MLKELYIKSVRYLVNRGYIGYRALNLTNYGVKYDAEIGRIYQIVGGRKIYLQHPKHGVPDYNGRNTLEWLCKDIYYGSYLPRDGDVVLDIGTGYGHEIAWLRSKSDVTIICVEPNPEVFLYLQVNLSGLSGVVLQNFVVGSRGEMNFPFTTDYASATSNSDVGGISVRGCTLEDLIKDYDEVALLKLNIEGEEAELLEANNLSKITRIIVSCHDFRAHRGEGDNFRTHERVVRALKSKGYRISDVKTKYYPSESWRKSIRYWIFAYREGAIN